MTVISLSTIPTRFDKIGPTLESLLAQRGDIEEIRLHVPHHYRRFPDYDGHAPKLPDGVTLIRPETDLGPASKVLFSARDLRGSGRRILFCDDDQDYQQGWAAALIEAARDHPDKAVCLRGGRIDSLGFAPPRETWGLPDAVESHKKRDLVYQRRRLTQKLSNLFRSTPAPRPKRRIYAKAGRVDHFAGVCGVCVDPDWFDDLCFDIPPVIWAVDDFLLSGHMARHGVPIWAIAAPAELQPRLTEADNATPLRLSVIEEHNRRQADAAAVRYFQETYGIWL